MGESVVTSAAHAGAVTQLGAQGDLRKQSPAVLGTATESANVKAAVEVFFIMVSIFRGGSKTGGIGDVAPRCDVFNFILITTVDHTEKKFTKRDPARTSPQKSPSWRAILTNRSSSPGYLSETSFLSPGSADKSNSFHPSSLTTGLPFPPRRFFVPPG